MRVAVTGCSSDFGTVILPRLFADPDVEEVLGIDLREPRVADPKLRFEREDVRSPRMRELLEGFDAVVHLAFVVAEIHDKELTHDVNLNGSRNVIEAADAAGAKRLVIASSVASYGVHPDNPDPITEEQFPRGNPDKYYFYDKAEVEHFIEWWQARHPDSQMTITRLRPVVIVGPHFSSPLLDAAFGPRGVSLKGGVAFQYLYEDDLADAFHRVIRESHPGPFNVAPDDVTTSAEFSSMQGQRVTEVSPRVARTLADVLFRLRLSPASSDWILTGEARADSGRLQRETGWQPRFSSSEAAHIAIVQHGRSIVETNGELRRPEVAEAALAPTTALVRELCETVPGAREAIGGGEGFDRALERIEHDWLPFKTGDVHLEVHEADDAAATIVFSPGIGGHARFYAPALAALREAGFNAIGVDRPGHGLSSGRIGDCPMDMALEVLDAVIRHARRRFAGTPVVLGGSSLGGIITWYALSREPDVDAAFCHNMGHPELPNIRLDRINSPIARRIARVAPQAPVSVKKVGDFGAVALEPKTLAYFQDETDRLWRWRISARTAASISAFRPQIDWRDVRIPTLVLVGERDEMVTPDWARRSLERSSPPTAELRVLPGAGHMLPLDHLPEFIGELAPWITQTVAEPVRA